LEVFKLLLLLITVGIGPLASATEFSSAQRALATTAYEIGTDIGGEYLNTYGAKLHTLVILRECDERELHRRLGNIPPSFNYFMDHRKSQIFVGEDKLISAQVTNGFLLGYQFAVRLEYQRADKKRKASYCDEAKLLANGFISGEL
jgi:hypothetical protein